MVRFAWQDGRVMAAYGVTDLPGFLCAEWELVREIVAADGTELGRFTGFAEFTSRHGALRYDERGELRLAEYQGIATRTLYYRLEGPTRCTVWFDDGRFFHDLELGAGRWEVQHPCRADLYRGSFEVFGPDEWRQQWRVAGPEKAYELTTRFTRLALGARG